MQSDSTAAASDVDDKKQRRREQNRLSAQRSYHKKQERLQVLWCQVSQLEAQYANHVTGIVAGTPATELVATPPRSEFSAASPVASPSNVAFQSLLADRAKLQSENDALRRRIDDQTKFQFRLQSLAGGEDAATSEHSNVTMTLNNVTGSPRFQPRIKMKRPLTVEECYTIGSNAYQRIRRYKFPDHYSSSTTPMFGWSDKRVMDDGLVKVQLQKVFHNHDAAAVARTSWLAVQDPRKMDSLYSLNMNMHSEITQRIDDNNVVMYQSYETPERDAEGNETGAICVMHHVMLLTFFQTETGYIVIFCSLDPDRLDDSDHIVDLAEEEDAVARGVCKRRRKQWFKKFSWLRLDHAGAANESTQCTYLFTVPGHHGATFYWPLEILLLILRYEMAAVGPTILLPPSSNDDDDDNKLDTDSKALLLLDDGIDLDDEMTSEAKVKIEPLAYVSGGGDRLSCSNDVDGVDDMDKLFVELFP